MLSLTPADLKDISSNNMDKQILRLGMIAELDAISLYEQLAAKATNEKIKTILLDVAKEEKTHMGEFEALLLRVDEEQNAELKNAIEEVLTKVGPGK
jgi:rubrerythrin